LILAAACLPLAAQTYTFQAFSYPYFSNVYTRPMGINNRGAVVGVIIHVSRPPCASGFIFSGFKRHADGVFEKPIADPTVTSGGDCYLVATGINKYGEIIGTYVDNNTGNYSGFLINNGVLSSYLVPGSSNSFIYGINGNGDFVGESDLRPPAFVNRNGVVSHFKYPGAGTTVPNAIAADGTIVGYFAIFGHPFQAFLRGPAGQFAPLKVPGAHASVAYGVNNAAHQIVGMYDDRIHTRGFVYDYTTGVYATVEYPDPNIAYTIITGVNSHGVIVGYASVRDAQGNLLPEFGFIGTPQ